MTPNSIGYPIGSNHRPRIAPTRIARPVPSRPLIYLTHPFVSTGSDPNPPPASLADRAPAMNGAKQ